MRKLLIAALSLVMFASVANAQTLTFCQSGLPVTLDTGTDGNSLTPAYQVLEPLVSFKAGTGDTVPGLATHWFANEDSTEWFFILRDDVTFHDGTPFNAEAVAFNFDRWNNPENAYRFDKPFTSWLWVFGGFLGDGSVLESVDVVNEYVVSLKFNDSVSFVPAMVASSYFGIHSPKAVQEGGESYGTPNGSITGTGAFVFDSWDDGAQVAMTRNDGYWGDAAKVENLVILGIEDPTARLAQIKSGACDIAVNLSSDDYQTVLNDDKLSPAMVEANLNVGYLAFHQDQEPFDNEKVRQAIAYAIDQEAIVDAFYAGLGQVASQHLPPTLFGLADLEPYAYDPDKAIELLKEAGFEDGFDTELWYMPVSRPYYPAPEDIATAMASFLADVGINAELRTQDWGTYLENYRKGEFPMYMLGWSADYADPDNFLYTFFGPSAEASKGWKDAAHDEVLELLNAARRAPSQAERAALYEQVNTIVHDTMVSFPVAHNRVLNVTRTDVEGFIPSPIGSTIPLSTVSK